MSKFRGIKVNIEETIKILLNGCEEHSKEEEFEEESLLEVVSFEELSLVDGLVPSLDVLVLVGV